MWAHIHHRKSHHRISTLQDKRISTTHILTQDTQKPDTVAAANHLYHFLWLSLIATCVKLLLIPAYHSTDIEVHRNWHEGCSSNFVEYVSFKFNKLRSSFCLWKYYCVCFDRDNASILQDWILEIQQVFRRMFPFGRGLCHDYWAPNFWVLYIILDNLLTFLLLKLGFNIQVPTASFTGGLVGDSSPFAVLPRITPLITFAMVLVSISPCLIKAWRDPNPRMVIIRVAYAYSCGFMFGWHVHEKASQSLHSIELKMQDITYFCL